MQVKSNKLKKIIQEELDPILNEKGFYFSESRSVSVIFVYAKEIDIDEKKYDSVEIQTEKWDPAITVDLHSHIRGGLMGLDFLHNNKRKKWSIASENEAEESLKEIRKLIEEYAWGWFYINE